MDLSRLATLLKAQNFEPEDSQIVSSLMHPQQAIQKGANWFQNNVNTAMGVPDPKYQDESSPYTFGPTDKQKAESAFNLAGLAGTGSMPFNKVGGPATLGMFVGPKSSGWDAVKAAEAEKLLNAGADPAQVWKEHLIGRMPSGHLFSEISDKDALLNNIELNKQMPLHEAYFHNDLYNAYPELKNTTFNYKNLDDVAGTYINKQNPELIISNQIPIKSINITEPSANSYTAHELQHGIQYKEGWPIGTNPYDINPDEFHQLRKNEADEFQKLMRQSAEKYKNATTDLEKQQIKQNHNALRDEADRLRTLDSNGIQLEMYLRNHGEAQARATQNRLNMDMQQRAENYPFSNGMFGGIPINKLQIKY